MNFYVYVIKNNLGRIYIGQTNNLQNRLLRHNKVLPNKKNSFTAKNGGDWCIVYKEVYPDRISAIKREKELKSFQGRQFIKNKINRP